jgi:hypothetical protein
MTDQSSVSRRRPVVLSAWARWTSGVVGAAGLGLGATAAFTRNLEAPPVALMAIGGVFLLVGLAGVMPTRLKIGDNEAEWQLDEYRDLVAEFVDDVTPVEQQRIVERLAYIDPAAAASAMSGMTYERTILGMLQEVVEARGDILVDGPAVVTGVIAARFDALIMRADGQRGAVVEIKKTRTSMMPDWVDDLHEQLVAAVQGHAEVQMLLLIVDRPLSLPTQKRFNQFADMRYIVVGGRHDIQLLQVAIEGVIGQDERERNSGMPDTGND